MSLDDLARELGQGIDCCDEEACCDDDGDCGPGEHCVEGECYENECDDENCPPGQPGCECPPGQHCEGGECVTGPCDDDGDCAPGQECVDGDCTCDDDDDCPSGDACADGLCEDCPGECCDNADCDDGNPCTMDVCSRGECNHFPKNCDDHNVCTDDHCNPIDGSCYHTPSSYCDDDNPCTEDECDPVTGECTHTCDECADCPYGLCFGCECETTNCDVNISAEPSTVCWGSPVELTIGTSCDPACGSMAWTITAEPVNTVEFIDMPSGNTPCDNSSHVHTVQARIACVPPEQITFRIDGDRGGTECSDTATITTMECITIIGERINQDDPASTTWIGLAEGAPIFGGSEPSTADNGRLMIDPEPGVMDIKWWVIAEGCGQFAAPPSGPEATTWNLGDILQPCPGLITFYVQVTFEDGKQQCGDFKSEIGVRTDDVIVVGWINGWQVPLNPNGVNQEILNIFWPPGPPVPSSIDCNDFVFDLSLFDATPNGIDLTPADRIYILHWLFRYAGNPDPIAVLGPLEFRTVDDSMIDYGKVALYKNTKTHYKLFNHFQTRYLANDDGYTELVSLRAETDI
ncbi:MAG: hypothetical protein JETCAE02_28840 [Anaerolineaceae bacterium]|nr:MAG: hypothetical protein JETCAE02_28840 [Anaerolineaceae bacterium]